MQPELNWCQQDYSRVCVCMTDRTDLVLIASTFPGCSIYLCISGNRPVKSDVLYLGSPSPTPKQKWLEAKSITHARRGESQILTKAKGSPKSPGFHLSKNELKNFTIVCDNLAEMTISQFFFFQTKIIDWMGECSCLSLFEVIRLVLLRSFQNLGYGAENWCVFCSPTWGIFCFHCLTTTSCRIWLQHGSILI